MTGAGSGEYVYVFTVLALPTRSQAMTLRVVATVKFGLFHIVEELQLGLFKSVVYLIVHSLAVHVGDILPQKLPVLAVHVVGGGGVVSKVICLLVLDIFHR